MPRVPRVPGMPFSPASMTISIAGAPDPAQSLTREVMSVTLALGNVKRATQSLSEMSEMQSSPASMIESIAGLPDPA